MGPGTWIALGLSSLTFLLALYLAFRRAPPDPRVKELQDRLARVETLVERLDPLMRQELSSLRGEQSRQMGQVAETQRMQLTGMGEAQMRQLALIMQTNNDAIANLTKTTDQQLKDLRESVAARLQTIQGDNAAQLEKMRETVDEKLHKTLEERLGQSFSLVSERLEQVQKGLGEMQTLAVGVGDLKKVLTNVKTRGTMGEYQLGSILEQLLAPEQYAANVRTVPRSAEVVEYAIRLPGKDADGNPVWLPIDSKFPVEDYYALQAAYDLGDAVEIEARGKALETAFRKAAKDIHDKYVSPPDTTDFGILFVPVEGLYAEVVRRPALMERLQNDYKISVAGPATFAALLNSLRMGFRTLAIEKRSSEVWKILSAVKTEFSTFGKVLASAKKKIDDAGDDIDALVGVRSRQILRRLGDVTEMKPGEARALLDPGTGEVESVGVPDDVDEESAGEA